MTTPSSIDGLTTQGFHGQLTPSQVQTVLNELVTGAPFAGSLTRVQTATGRAFFPVAAPTGFAWLQELERVPDILLNDSGQVVVVAKVAGILPISSEMLSDSSLNVTGFVSGAIQDSLSRDVDEGVLRGTGTPQPDGLIDQCPVTAGPTLIAAVGAAIAEVGEAGGTVNTLALSPTDYAAELTSVNGQGDIRHPDGMTDLAGLQLVQVPGLEQPICYDSTRVFLVLGTDGQVTIHDDPRHDAQLLLVKARINVAAPVAAKSIRKLSVGGNGTEPTAARTARTSAKTKTA